MREKILFTVLILLLCNACNEIKIPAKSSCIFDILEKNIFIETTKYKGGKFKITFANIPFSINDSLTINDYIEFRTGGGIRIIIMDSVNIYLASDAYSNSSNPWVTDMRANSFKIKTVQEEIFQTFFTNGKVNSSYSFISIDTKEYSVHADERTIKKGNMYGGW